MNRISEIELLLPAGDFQKMKYAYAYGADATYLGIPRFSLRARENGFKENTVVSAIHYAHELGKKVYLTANIIPHNHKVQPFLHYVDRLLAEIQPDAWIMSDPGIIAAMKEKHPEQNIHLSVQANCTNYAAARFWQSMGIDRIILSRELSLKEIGQIRAACPDLELEAFVHGSICIAYSGRCLISNYMSGRDPNQGTCSHSCRWVYKVYAKNPEETPVADNDYTPLSGDYYLEESKRPGEFIPIDEDENGTYFMNARDLCAIEYLSDLQAAGVNSFKVEGRNKSVYYTVIIARAYRWAMNDLYRGNPFNADHLAEARSTANRGFIPGFLLGNPGAVAQKYDSDRPEKATHRFAGIVHTYDEKLKRIKVEPRNPIRVGMTLELITPDQTSIFPVTELYNNDMEAIEIIHGGLHYCWIPCQQDPGPMALLRESVVSPVGSEL
ncbi:MAG: U32 family peptidase C-terminal domain-containing protein [Fidelibacterota bacterium]